MKFKLQSKFKPAGDQPIAIKKLVEGYEKFKMQTLQGITGSGKTFTIANLIEKVQKPTLVLAHNKTLAAQLYQELKELFPHNRVEYFISYYDYYQPESYIAATDTYIEKESTINEEIEKLRLKTLTSLISRDDVIVIASISCIYGAGNPQDFEKLSFEVKIGQKIKRSNLLLKLVDMLYKRNNIEPKSGEFRVVGDVIDIVLGYDDKTFIRIEMFDDEIENISMHDKITKERLEKFDKFIFFPAKQFVVLEDKVKKAKTQILEELNKRTKELGLLEAQRLKKKVNYDLEMMQEVGYCSGIENYSRYFDNRKKGEPPFVLLDYFPKNDFLLVIDESHQSIPQSRAMFNGDFSRKKNLVDFGFRLPSAYDNRPLKFIEFEKYFNHAVFVSATPADYELEHSGQIVEQLIRPTGLLDPIVEVRSSEGQIKDLIDQINKITKKNQRILVTTITKKMAEDLTNFLAKKQIKVRYMHSDIESLDRIELIRQLRAGDFDVLIGINLLREGLDIPEVSLVCILDADKSGFLRDERSLIQIIGRAARNVDGRVIMYGDFETKAMKNAIKITKKRRELQEKFNKKNNIIPKTIIKEVEIKKREIRGIKHMGEDELKKKLIELEAQMRKAAENLDFEEAINLRDEIEYLKREEKYK